MVPDGDVLVLGGVGDDLQQPPHFGLGIEGHAEQFWGKHTKIASFGGKHTKIRIFGGEIPKPRDFFGKTP